MKNLNKLPAILVGLLLLLTGTTNMAMAQNEDVSLQSFYDELSPYGTWIQDPEYGYVWRPDVDQEEFRPYYSNGRWVMTEYGNTWVSNYDWGWAPFHYGRWIYNRYNNWIWIPDTVWGPAWVSWRSGGGYYGWAPLGPSINININIGRSYRVPDFCWNFIPQAHIYYNSYPRYYGGRNNVYIRNTVIINNTYVRNSRTYYTGPRIDDVRRATNRDVTVYNVSRSNRPSRIENNTVNIYNPRPSRSNDNNGRPSPKNVVAADVRRDVINRDNVVSSRPERGNSSNTERNNGVVANRGSERDNNNGGRFGGRDNNQPQRDANTTNGRENGRPQRDVNSIPGNRTETRNENSNSTGSRPSIFDRNRENNNQPQREVNMDRGNRGETRGENGNSRPSIFDRSNQPQRVESQPSAPQRMERQEPQRMERQAPQQMPQRIERMERPQQQAPQRMERQQPQRTESSPGSSRGGGNEGRGNGGGGGRPGRG